MPTNPDDIGQVDCLDEHGEVTARITLRAIRRRGKEETIPLLSKLDESEALKECEAPLQLRENGRYRCTVEDLTGKGRTLAIADNQLVECYGDEESPDVLIETRSTAGRLNLQVVDTKDKEAPPVGRGAVEICSTKLHYREEYRGMVKSIAKDAREMLLQLGGATEFSLQSAWSNDSPTLVQQIEFMRSLLHGGGLWKPLERILRMPHERLEAEAEQRPLARVGKAGPDVLRQLASGQPRMQLPEDHLLNDRLKGTAPRHVAIRSKRRTTDTPENRFIKHMLMDFTRFLQHAADVLEAEQGRHKRYASVIGDCERMKESINRRLQSGLFRQLGPPRTPPFGSPVLQRKAGYREVFQIWLAFKMSAHLQWEGSEDVFGGGKSQFDAGKKDLPTLYEAWLFFKLLKVFTEKFGLNYEATKEFFTSKDGKLGHFTLKRGTPKAIGSAAAHGLRVQAKFRYNHEFSNQKDDIGLESSWTRVLRPDYTISIWPEAMDAEQAERSSAMVHIHFDAKYRVDKISELFGDVENEEGEERTRKLNEEKQKETEGNYNRADLLKMHAYRDAIRRSEGAFVLYPGDTGQATNNKKWKSYHELLPGLGAFAVRPDENGEAKGIEAVANFLDDAVKQVTNRASRLKHSQYSQREEDALNVKESRISDSHIIELMNKIISEVCEEADTPAQKIIVLSGIVKGPEHQKWIESKGRYNFRAQEKQSGYLPSFAPNFPDGKILVLRDEEGNPVPGMWRIVELEEWDKERLESEEYPTEPSLNHYTVLGIQKIGAAEGIGYDGEIFKTLMSVAHEKSAKRMGVYPENVPSASPFQINLKQLMGAVESKNLLPS